MLELFYNHDFWLSRNVRNDGERQVETVKTQVAKLGRLVYLRLERKLDLFVAVHLSIK